MLTFPKILMLAVIQGAAELLPVSSSAHVIVAEKLMGLNPTAPQMTFLLVMLHTGTMFAVIVYFWKSWKAEFFKSQKIFLESVQLIAGATLATVVLGLLLIAVIKKIVLKGASHAEIEMIFGNLPLIAASLTTAGALILWAGYHEIPVSREKAGMGMKEAVLIGLVQGICLPFRGFSRSGATISTGMILGIQKRKVEDFSFALAVVITPPVILAEALRFLKAQHAPQQHPVSVMALFLPGIIGMVLSFFSGLMALKWLSSWLEGGRWYLFGIYCLCASIVIAFLYVQGL